jgi:glycerol-3-phosphate acyltransferase PlsY
LNYLFYIGAGLLGYLVGSIPVGLFVGKAYGVDVRQVGSGRTGGTNVYRAAGAAAGIIAGLGDAIKGLAAVLFLHLVGGDHLAMVIGGLGAIAGHNWSLYLGFRGGAGTMTNLGATLAISPLAFALAVPVGVLSLYVSRMASVGSLAVSFTILLGGALLVLVQWESPELLLYGVVMTAMIVYSLRPNIQRILQGTERRIGGQR